MARSYLALGQNNLTNAWASKSYQQVLRKNSRHDQIKAKILLDTICRTSLQEGVTMQKKSAKKQALKHSNIASTTRGFSLSETLIALAAGTLVIGGGATALQSMQTLIKNNGEKTAQRQNITNGVRLMRSEIERSLHTLVNGTPPDEELAYTDLGKYVGAIDYCRQKSIEQQEGSFIPLFWP